MFGVATVSHASHVQCQPGAARAESSVLVMCVLLLAANYIPRIASMESYDNLLCRLKAF